MSENRKINAKVSACRSLMQGQGWKIIINYLPETSNIECVTFTKNNKLIRVELGFIGDNTPNDIKKKVERSYMQDQLN